MTTIFIWDFVVDLVLGQILDWLYGQIVGFLSAFFEMMGNMGAELFSMDWVQAIVLFFSYFAWSLYGIGLVVSVCEFGIEYQTGRARPRPPIWTRGPNRTRRRICFLTRLSRSLPNR